MPAQTFLSASQLRFRLRAWTWAFLAGLILSGLTAIPIRSQFELGRRWLGSDFRANGWIPEPVARWLTYVDERTLLADTHAPFIWYGTDWLAFGHVAVALAFIGALRDPVRNRWLYDYGLWVCALVIPWALCFGALRGIPWWWRFIDASFGIVGALPLLLCRRWAAELERRRLVSRGG